MESPHARGHQVYYIVSVAQDSLDVHFVVLGALLFFLVMAIFAALGFQP
jgi:hypothetical protein